MLSLILRNPRWLTLPFAIFFGLSLSACGTSGTSGPSANAATAASPTDKEIVDAWTYLFGRYLVLQQENHDIQVEKVGYNTIKYNPLGSAQFVNPNLDVAYLEAWIAVDPEHAVILNVPRIEGRYYTAQLLDGWGEVIANINERTFPAHPSGKFALIIKGTNPPVPADVVKVELPAGKIKMLARVELKGSPQAAQALQRQFTLAVPPGIRIDPPHPVPSFTPQEPLGTAIFDEVPAVLATYPDAMPRAGEYQALARKVAAYLQSGPSARARVDAVVKGQAIPNFMAAAKGFGKQQGGWSVTYAAGNFGNDILARDIVNYGGLWANRVSEAIYFVGLTDSNKQVLNGSKTYEIRFPAGALPSTQVNAFWSVTLYSVPDYRVVPNAMNRYNLNNLSPLKPNPDGTTSLWLGPTSPTGVANSNWLPTPAGRDFALNFRMYVAKPDVVEGRWFPPAIRATRN